MTAGSTSFHKSSNHQLTSSELLKPDERLDFDRWYLDWYWDDFPQFS